ncbi:MAG: nuclear transport factor 2 family protein [Rubrobacteraceae bacterium]
MSMDKMPERSPKIREDYIKMVEDQYFANVDLKDLEAVLDCFHHDAVFVVQSAFSTHEGRDTGIKEMFERLFRNYAPKILHSNFRHVVDVPKGCCASQFSVENISAYDGTEAVMSNCNFFYFDGEKIKSVYVYMSGGQNTLG